MRTSRTSGQVKLIEMAQLTEPQRLVTKQTHARRGCVRTWSSVSVRPPQQQRVAVAGACFCFSSPVTRHGGGAGWPRLSSVSQRGSSGDDVMVDKQGYDSCLYPAQQFDGSKLQSGRHELGAELAVQYNRRWMMEPASTGSPLNI
jgi:hypothetical protein